MITAFEQDVRTSFIAAKLGDRIHEVADVDVHFVLPLMVFDRYHTLIAEVTGSEFNVAAGYNLVLLYTDPQISRRAGTVLFGRDLDGLVAAWSNVLEDIAADPDKASRQQKFKAAHSHFRSALWVKPSGSDPCASKNPLPKVPDPAKKSFWSRMLN